MEADLERKKQNIQEIQNKRRDILAPLHADNPKSAHLAYKVFLEEYLNSDKVVGALDKLDSDRAQALKKKEEIQERMANLKTKL